MRLLSASKTCPDATTYVGLTSLNASAANRRPLDRAAAEDHIYRQKLIPEHQHEHERKVDDADQDVAYKMIHVPASEPAKDQKTDNRAGEELDCNSENL